eukprot:scaffold537_cov241-Pinguiococcus_pyrenoidosus.AAC.9
MAGAASTNEHPQRPSRTLPEVLLASNCRVLLWRTVWSSVAVDHRPTNHRPIDPSNHRPIDPPST